MKREIIIYILLISLSAALYLPIPPSRQVHAETPQQAIICLDPQNITDPTLTPCNNFTVAAKVQNAENVFTWQVKIFWNPSILECLEAWIPEDSIFNFPVKPTPEINNDEGWAAIGASQIFGEGVSGSDVLAYFKFHVIGIGRSPLSFGEYDVDTYLLDPDLFACPGTLEDGIFSNWIPPPPALIYVNPERIVNPTLEPCSEFNVTIDIINATDVYSWELTVFYFNDILNATEISEGDFMKSQGTTAFSYEAINDYNATHGMIKLNCSFTEPISVSGDGTLAQIKFHVVGEGNTPIKITQSKIYDVALTELPHETRDGYFNNILIGELRVEPSEIIDPSLVPCSSFNINITLNNVEGLKTCEFNLTYNPTVLSIDSWARLPVLGQLPTYALFLDDEAGFLWIRLTYPEPISTYTPIPLIAITYHIKELGQSPLNLTESKLKDAAGADIIHETYSGFFATITRDIAIINVTPSYTWVYQGWLVQINITVRNEGDINETFTIKGLINETLIDTIIIENLPPNTETTVKIIWDTTEAQPNFNYTVSAIVDPLPYETDTSDNQLIDGTVTVRYMGDVNGDGKVNMSDVGIACAAFMSYPGHPRWNPDVDLDQNMIVNMIDIAIILKNFGLGL